MISYSITPLKCAETKWTSGIIINATSSRRLRLRNAEIEADNEATGIEFLSDVPLKITVTLAEAQLPLRELLKLGGNSVVQLNKLSGEPVDIYVEDQKLGKGEIIVLREKLRIRLLEITPASPDFEASSMPEEH